MAFKAVWVGSRTHRLSAAEQRNEALPGLLRSPEMLRHELNTTVSGLKYEGCDVAPVFDEYHTCWFADRRAFYRFTQAALSPLLPAPGVVPADRNFTTLLSAQVTQHLIIDGERPAVKAVWFMRFKPEVSSDAERVRAAYVRWASSHGRQFGRRVPGIERYVQNHVTAALAPVAGGAALPEFCGYSECWFNSRAALLETLASPQWAAMNADARDLFDSPWSVQGRRAVVEETVLKPSPRAAP